MFERYRWSCFGLPVAHARLLAGLLGITALTTACAGAPTGPSASIPADAIRVLAVDMTFQPGRLSVPADRPFALVFDNADQVPHNLVIIGNEGARLVAGDVFTGAAVRLLQVPALAPGTYRLHCDVHPEMRAEVQALPGLQ